MYNRRFFFIQAFKVRILIPVYYTEESPRSESGCFFFYYEMIYCFFKIAYAHRQRVTRSRGLPPDRYLTCYFLFRRFRDVRFERTRIRRNAREHVTRPPGHPNRPNSTDVRTAYRVGNVATGTCSSADTRKR